MITYNLPHYPQTDATINYSIRYSHQSTYIPNTTIEGIIKYKFLDDAEEKNNIRKIINEKKIEEYSQLPHNWNGNEAQAFSASTIDTAREIIGQLNIQPEIFPLDDDSIQLEWDGELDSYLEIKLTNEDMYRVFYIDQKGKESIESIPAQASSINQRVFNFYTQNVTRD